MKLKEIGIIPFSNSLLQMVYPANKSIAAKAKRLEDKGEIIRLKRGLYVASNEITDRIINEFLIANHLHGPSYVSMHSALRFYGIIPERVFEITSMTPRHAKTYTNKIGRFSYVHCSEEYYSIGLRSMEENEINFMIASPEKALCDTMIYTPNLNLRYQSEIKTYLEENLRADMQEIANFDLEILRECSEKGKKQRMIQQLIKFIQNERHI